MAMKRRVPLRLKKLNNVCTLYEHAEMLHFLSVLALMLALHWLFSYDLTALLLQQRKNLFYLILFHLFKLLMMTLIKRKLILSQTHSKKSDRMKNYEYF